MTTPLMTTPMWTPVDWALAASICDNFKKSLPGLIDEDCVFRYHEILESFEGAGNLHLADFAIDESRVSYRRVFGRAAGGGSLRETAYTEKKYCDAHYFTRQLDRLRQFLGDAEEGSLHYAVLHDSAVL